MLYQVPTIAIGDEQLISVEAFARKRLPTLCPSPHQKPHFLL